MDTTRPTAMNEATTPTPPEPFGYKTGWFALPSVDIVAVARALELQNVQQANWHYGLSRALDSEHYSIFVTPPVNRWILAVGVPILFEGDEHYLDRMVELSRKFGEAQYFASMRISSVYIWARAGRGKLIRCFSEQDGERREVGEPTEAEKRINFFDPNSREAQQPEYWDRKDLEYPDEEHVLRIASDWSVNPANLDQIGLAPALGLLGEPSASYPPRLPPFKPTLFQRFIAFPWLRFRLSRRW